jgi:Chlorophyll A-B binding protein
MFRALAILASIVGASAFAPASRVSGSSALKMSYANEAGVTKPAGFFDPLNLSKNKDAETFAAYRAAELKHGRVCQLAVLGYIVPEVTRFPGEIAPGVSFASIPNGIAAIEAVPALGWMQMIFLIGFVDFSLTTKGNAGIFTNKNGFKEFASEEAALKATNQELNHGRLAMLATLELLRHDSQQLIGGMYKDDAVMSPMITGLPFIYGN